MSDFECNLDDVHKLAAFGRALSVPVRVELLKLLSQEELNINEIADRMNIPQSTAVSHVKILTEAGLIKTSLKPAQHGAMKMCKLAIKDANIMFEGSSSRKEVHMLSMPVGQFTDYKVEPTCGLAGPEGPIGAEDSPNSFYHPDRVNAELLWFCNGYVEYRFPNHMLDGTEESVEFSMELCSEDHEYNLNCISDITVWVNGKEVGTWTCPSDFGGRRGRCNPKWWPDKNTQYGKLKHFKITGKGSYLDGRKTSPYTLEEYGLRDREYISLRIGIKPDARHNGGVNLFGEGFGDFAQNILMKTVLNGGK